MREIVLLCADIEDKVMMKARRVVIVVLCAVVLALMLGLVLFLLVGPGLLDSESDFERSLGRTALDWRIALRMAGPDLLLCALDATVDRSVREERGQTYALVLKGYGRLGSSDKDLFIRGVERAILESGSLDYAECVKRFWPQFSLDFIKEGVVSDDAMTRTIARCVVEPRVEAGELAEEAMVELVSYILSTGLSNGNDEIVADALYSAIYWKLKDFLAAQKEVIKRMSRSPSRRASGIARYLLEPHDKEMNGETRDQPDVPPEPEHEPAGRRDGRRLPYGKQGRD